MGSRMYVFCIVRNGEYDPDESFESAADAIYAAVELGETVAVLDALSLEYLGSI